MNCCHACSQQCFDNSEMCKEIPPLLYEINENHRVACYHAVNREMED